MRRNEVECLTPEARERFPDMVGGVLEEPPPRERDPTVRRLNGLTRAERNVIEIVRPPEGNGRDFNTPRQSALMDIGAGISPDADPLSVRIESASDLPVVYRRPSRPHGLQPVGFDLELHNGLQLFTPVKPST